MTEFYDLREGIIQAVNLIDWLQPNCSGKQATALTVYFEPDKSPVKWQIKGLEPLLRWQVLLIRPPFI